MADAPQGRLRVSRLPRLSLAILVHDVVMATVALLGGFWLRLNDQLASYPRDVLVENTVIFALVAAVVFVYFQLNRGVWRYASLNDLRAIAFAATATVLVYFPMTFIVTRLEGVPRTTLVITWLLLVVLLGAPRFAYRAYRDRNRRGALRGDVEQVVLVGGGDEAEAFVRATQRDPRSPYAVVAIIDRLPERVGYQIHGVDVVGSVGQDLEKLVAAIVKRGASPTRLVLADKSLPSGRVRSLFDAADKVGLPLSRAPSATDLHEPGERFRLRPIALEDLLNRPPTNLDLDGLSSLVKGKRVLVTGAGGSIGSEMVRQLADQSPSKLIIIDNGEFNLYEIDLEIRRRAPTLDVLGVVADVRDRDVLDRLFARERPDLVFHAAALKHVPIVELNPIEGLRTNLLGSRNVADACARHGVQLMVMISTDKAVNPTNVMGASKRAAESYCQALDIALNSQGRHGCRYATVRFGNVLGSRGSVVPLFQRQLASGGPLTVTHPEIERYFMTIREAVELVLQAAVLRVDDQEDETGKLFVLDMGEPVRIVDLARQMIRLAGLEPNKDVEILFTGLRPGEKLYEELFHDMEALVATAVSGIRLASPRVADHAVMARAIDGVEEQVLAGRVEATLARLRALVPEYRPEGQGAAKPAPS